MRRTLGHGRHWGVTAACDAGSLNKGFRCGGWATR
jgi:hypothetical protein